MLQSQLPGRRERLVQCFSPLGKSYRLDEDIVEKRFKHIEEPLGFAGFDGYNFPGMLILYRMGCEIPDLAHGINGLS